MIKIKYKAVSFPKSFKSNDYRELRLNAEKSYFDNNRYKVFPDGIKIKLDENRWSKHLLGLNPQERLPLNK